MEPVRLRAGADFGQLDFVRIGTTNASEVNVVGFAANFAAKCEKYALSWQMVLGESLADLLPVDDVELHDSSPKRYTRQGNEKRYHFYNVNLSRYLELGDQFPEQLKGSRLSSITTH